MAKIENPKTYTGQDLETIFFRPMLGGQTATDLGIKIMYNMPVPTTLQFWKRAGDILQSHASNGWNGGAAATKYQKSIQLSKVKAEIGYSAEDYFNMVYERITNRADINMGDLSGSELEVAETALFKEAIAESIRATMWLGDATRTTTLKTFDGFLKRMMSDLGSGDNDIKSCVIANNIATSTESNVAENLFKNLWNNSSDVLKAFKAQGNLVYLVTSDIYAKYEEELDHVILESAYLAKQNGREGLSFRGIPVVDIQVSSYLKELRELPQSFALLTDRRNLALAVNTSDFPGTEVRMWYNPDVMENRQRAIFMAGCDYLLPELVSLAIGGISLALTSPAVGVNGGAIAVKANGYSAITEIKAQGVKADGSSAGTSSTLTRSGENFSGTITGASIAKVKFLVTCTNAQVIEFTL